MQRASAPFVPEIFVSPDKTLHALGHPVDVSPYVTPDMESRVVIRTSDDNTLNSEDYSSPRGEQGYYVYTAVGRRMRGSSSTA